MEAIERLVGVTANAITQMKLIRMYSMTEPKKTYIQEPRPSEMEAGDLWRMLVAASCHCLTGSHADFPCYHFRRRIQDPRHHVHLCVEYLTLDFSPLP